MAAVGEAPIGAAEPDRDPERGEGDRSNEAPPDPPSASMMHEAARQRLMAQGMTPQQADVAIVQANEQELARRQFLRCFACVTVSVFSTSVAMLALQVWLATVYLQHTRRPCKVPLELWVIVSLVLWLMRICRPCIDRAICCWSPADGGDRAPMRIIMKERALWSANSIWVVFLGLYWFSVDGYDSTSCRVVSPDLFVAARVYAWYTLAAHLCSCLSIFVLRSFLAFVIRRGMLSTDNGAPAEAIKRNTQAVDLTEAELAENPSCPICMEDYTDSEGMTISKITLCDHVFHEKCLGNWLKAARSCPLCREDITQEVAAV